MRVFRKFTFTFVVESLRERFPRRPARRMLAAAFALLLCAGAAQAQTTVELVGTTGQTENTSSTQSRFINDRAQAFTTGSNASGYTLKRIDLPMSYNGHTNPTAPTYTVKIHDATSSGPGSTVLGTLTNPASVADGTNSYTTAGIVLEPDTTYFVVIDVTGTGSNFNHHRISNDITNSDNEDAGAYAGWSVANGSLTRQFQASSWTNRGFSWKMEIHGSLGVRPPEAPAAPTLTEADGTSLTITWTAPAGAVDDYDVRYRRKGDTAWTDHPHTGTARTATINNLLQGASWEAQVAASNAGGPGQWSDTGSGHTGPARFVRAETGSNGGEVFVRFTKSLNDSGTETAYVINRNSVGAGVFVAILVSDQTQLGLVLTNANSVQAGQTVTVSYAKPSTGSKLTDADGEEIASFSGKSVTNLVQATAPGLPAAPTVSAVSNSRNLSVSWTAPTSSSSITDYDLRYYAGSSDPDDEDDWVLENESSGLTDPGTSTSATLSGLAASTSYRVQVRAENAAGKGPWSSSGTGTTNASSATNNAPTLAVLGTSDCVAKTATTPFKTISAPAGNQVGASPILSTANCTGSSRTAPMFIDSDGGTLTFTARIENLPDNVVLADRIPIAHATDDQVYVTAAAAFKTTDVRVDVTATDPHGASATGHFIAQVASFTGTNKPSFAANPGPQRFAHNQAIKPLVLPAATGGDVSTSGLTFPYFYAVDGLPAGLTFDAATRTISGTPTELGTYRVTYTAEDADDTASMDRSPTTVDSTDTASLTFMVQVGNQPGIERVRIVSKPQFDSNSDGTADTYVKGRPVLIDVEFSEPVKVTGNIRLRLDLGKDDTVLNNSQKGLTDYSVLHGGRTLRFKHTVGNSNNCSLTTQHGDCDPDGLWVQTRSSDNRVLFPGTANIVHAVTGEKADLTYAHLPTSGDPLHKVDGSKETNDIGPIPSDTGVEVNGATLKLVFAAGLAPPSDLSALRFDFFVRGAGGIGADDKAASQSPTAIVHRAVSKGDSFGGLELTLGTPARAGDTVTVSYTGTTLKGPGGSGKRAPKFRGLAVTNNTPGTSGPALLHASVTGTKLKMVFGANLNTGSLPAGSAFTVEATDLDEDTREIAGTGTVSITDAVVTVTLALALRADELASVSYEKPDTNPLRGSGSGPQVQSFERFRIADTSDGVAPKLRGGTVVQTGTSPAQSKMALYFDEALSTFWVPASGDFAVSVSGAAATVSAVAVEDRSVVLTLDRLAASGTLFEVTYTPGTYPIRDWAGNAAAGFRQTLSASATGAPVLQSARTEGGKVVLTYDKPLDPADKPAKEAFVFHSTLLTGQEIYGTPDDPNDPNDSDTTADTLGIELTGIEVSGKTAVLQLKDPVLPCVEAFELTYRERSDSTATPFQGLDGTDVGALASQTVTNGRAYRCNNSNWMEGARVGSIILRAKQPFATDVTPEASWFTVTASGGAVTVTAAAYSTDDAQELKLSLSRDLVPGETVTVSYNRPEGALGLWDTDGNQLGDIEDQAVDNPAAGAALTAAFNDVPAGHEGRGSEFSFELAFSENFGGKLDYKVLRDQAVQATNARVTGAKRVTQGQNRRWTITVRPRSSEDVTVTLPATADCSAAGAICTPDGRKLSKAASATVALAPARSESAATGAPTIAGTARVGETLTASTAGIADANGLTGASYAWQWVSGDADVSGATNQSYTLAEADAGKRIKVRVSFTDDDGYRETLTSAATGAVAPRVPPLTASFHGMPAEHDGRKLFSFELRFSENFPGRLDYKVLRDSAFQVTGGRVRGAKRVAPRQNQSWTISVRPSSHGDVTVTLPAGSVTTESGRALAEAVTATVQGPALLSVADAEAREGPEAAVEFTVSLSRATSGTVTVDYMTADGTAAAGEDYTATSGTLTFAAGERSKTVSVPVLDDVHDEGRETFTLKLHSAKGASIEDGEATGTIINSDEMPRAWLARFGRAAAEHVVDAIGGRFSSSSGTQMTLGGQALDWSANPDALTARGNALFSGAGPGLAEGGPLLTSANGFGLNERTGEDAEAPRHELSMPDLLLNSSFHVASADGAGGAGSGRWSVWGRAARSSFEGAEGALTLKGDVTTATLGFDYERGRWLAGVALSRSSGEGSYEKAGMRGEVESVLTGVYPYARYSVSERLSVWGVVGHGQGDFILEREGVATSMETDIETTMAAGGARGVLLPARVAGGFELALRADLLAVETSSDAASNLVASEVGTSRIRLLIEASRSFGVGAAGALAASAEAGLRYDGGDAETGSGLEVGGSLRWTSGSLTIEVAARGLMAHSDDDYEEWGVSGSVQYAQTPDGRGFSLRAGSAWGAAAGGAERIWSQAPGGFRAGGSAPGAGLDAEAGYGFGFRGGLLTPYTGVALSDSGQTLPHRSSLTWRAGARWKLGEATELALEASLRENTGGDAPESGVLLKGSRRW